MSDSPTVPSPEFLASIQPIVLVGGRSTRFGRDKLREPIGDHGELLVQRPISVLRAVFGPRVKLVGDCHPSIMPLADGVIADEYPGIGPMGGILSALRCWGGPVLVLAGDMPSMTADAIRGLITAGGKGDGVAAVLAVTDRLHPCVGVYTQLAHPFLEQRLGECQRRLADALPEHMVLRVRVNPDLVSNINCRSDVTNRAPLVVARQPARTDGNPRTA